MFFNPVNELKPVFSIKISRIHAYILVLTFYLNIFLMIFQGPILYLCNSISLSMFEFSSLWMDIDLQPAGVQQFFEDIKIAVHHHFPEIPYYPDPDLPKSRIPGAQTY